MNINPAKTLVILVGVGTYDEKEVLHSLPAAYSNASNLYNVLKNKVGIPPSNIYQIIDPKKGSELLEEIEEKTDADFNWELVIFYYSGHGVKSDDQTEYFLSTRSVRPSRPATNGVNLEQLIKNYLNTARLLMILDCCYSGKAFDSAKGKYDYYIMASSTFKETSKYPLNEDNSAFTKVLIESIENGVAKASEWITIEDIFDETKIKLEKTGFPKPTRLSKGELGDLFFVKNSGSRDNKTPLSESPNETIPEETNAELLYKKLRRHNKAVTEERQNLDARSESFQGDLAKLVLRYYPYPVAYFLKSILAEHKETENQDFYNTFYEQVIEFLAFILMVDLIDNKNDYTVGKLAHFDMNGIKTETCLEILRIGCTKFDGRLFIKEFVANADFLTSVTALQQSLINNEPTPTVKKNAMRFLGDIAFLASYKLIAIRNISVNKGYCPPSRFRHETSSLMGETLNNYQKDLVLEDKYLHNGTVMLFKNSGTKEINANDKYLNLWPLVVDANGFKEGSNKPDIYRFSKIKIDKEFVYEVITLKKLGLEPKPYTDINEFISDEDRRKYFDAFMKDFDIFF